MRLLEVRAGIKVKVHGSAEGNDIYIYVCVRARAYSTAECLCVSFRVDKSAALFDVIG